MKMMKVGLKFWKKDDQVSNAIFRDIGLHLEFTSLAICELHE